MIRLLIVGHVLNCQEEVRVKVHVIKIKIINYDKKEINNSIDYI